MVPLRETEQILAQLVAYPTLSADSNLDLIGYASEHLGQVGAAIEICPEPNGTRANLMARFGPDAPGGVMIAAQTDVVPADRDSWSTHPFHLTERNDLLFGRGTCDAKGFVASVLAQAQDWRDRTFDTPLRIALTHSDETDCAGARAVVTQLRRDRAPDLVLVGAPTGMGVVEAHPAARAYHVRFDGIDPTLSDDKQPDSALTLALRYANGLDAARAAEPLVQVTLGMLNAGTSPGISPGTALLQWEARSTDAEALGRVEAAIMSLVHDDLLPRARQASPGGRIETQLIGESPVFTAVPDNPARDLIAAITGRNQAVSSPQCSSAGVYQQAGWPTVLCGPGHAKHAHRPDEFVARDQLVSCLHMLRGLGERLAA